MNPLKAAYAAKSAGTPAATPVASSAPVERPVQTTLTPATRTPPAASSPAVGTPASSTTAAPARSLVEMRARLAGRNGGVNPPEATIREDSLDVKTRETPDGGAEPLVTAAATSDAPAPSTGTTAAEIVPVVALSRGQKAAVTRAANKAAAQSVTAGAVVSTEASAQPSTMGDALERIATALELFVELLRVKLP